MGNNKNNRKTVGKNSTTGPDGNCETKAEGKRKIIDIIFKPRQLSSQTFLFPLHLETVAANSLICTRKLATNVHNSTVKAYQGALRHFSLVFVPEITPG